MICTYDIWSHILFIIIVFKRGLSGTVRTRGLKFWLQVALSAPIATAWKQNRKSGSGSGKSGFSGKFFFAFFGFYGPLGTSGSPPDGPEPPNPDPDREIRFFRTSVFSLFRPLKLRTPKIWVSMESSGPN